MTDAAPNCDASREMDIWETIGRRAVVERIETDARITIDLEPESEDEWITYNPDDDAGIIGRGETGPRAAEDYCCRIVEYLEE